MRVTEIIIDGFKSYAVRTVISGWDESFNSITGLNGSGKSNILDAICFVLGITTLQTVRAQNLQDLIYKRGQAGVTKASVTIVFDNSDPEKSPIGYTDYPTISVTRQIVLGGTSKYLVNGTRQPQQNVHTLFQSVQLNINNPNFLIMQGRITKVLSMKATEILSMIEEAAGTRMFEDRKDKALKTMAKKNKKIEEIQELLRDEIDPKLEKLRMEKRAFLDYQQTTNDLERLQKLVVSFDYVKFGERLKKIEDELDKKQRLKEELEGRQKKWKMEVVNLEKEKERIQAQRAKEMRKGGRFQALEEEVKKLSHETVRINTGIELKVNSLQEEKGKMKEGEKKVKELEMQLAEKIKAFEKLRNQHDQEKAKYDASNEDVRKKEELLQTLLTGVGSKEGQENGYQGQLSDARNRASAAATEQEQAKLKISHLEKRIREEEPRAKEAKKQNSSAIKELENLRAEAKRLQSELEKLGFEDGATGEDLYKEEAAIQQRVRDLSMQEDSLRREVSNMDFAYNDPYTGFNRSKVKGLVAQLFHLDPEKAKVGTALEIAAGGKLYNVVVDTAETSSALLERGKLKKRVTIIPLNKIQSFRASVEKIAMAQRIAPGKVDLALSLIGYDEEVEAAMAYVFGDKFICEDPDTASRITYDPRIKMGSVTIDGDEYRPGGTITGGSKPQSAGLILKMGRLNAIARELKNEQRKLEEIQGTIAREKKKLDLGKQLKQQLDLKNHEIALTEQQINSNSASATIQGVEEMKANIGQLKKDIAEAKERQNAANKEIKIIEKDIADFKNNKGSKLAELQKSIDNQKKSLTKQLQALKSVQRDFQNAQLDAEQAETDLQAARDNLEEVISAVKSCETEIEALESEQASIKEAYDMAQATLQDETRKLSAFDDELKDIEANISDRHTRLNDESLELQKLGHELDKLLETTESTKSAFSALCSEHDWIESEKDQFGRAGTPYDFSSVRNINEVRSQLKTLKERSAGMKRKLNPKVMNMIDNVEKKEVSLKTMLRTVQRDKRKIEETIVTLDEYKREALIKTWMKVTEDFGNIFAELLPGSFAKLEPPEGKDVTEGLEVKVQLGKVWKQSLTELSGGQRSLIALSLILALLQFKPAPMYILDEVDAALDLSHTQNIGRLIKTRFKGSQFIVVSLKDGMFQNANRVFRTRFQDGTSVVTVEKGK